MVRCSRSTAFSRSKERTCSSSRSVAVARMEPMLRTPSSPAASKSRITRPNPTSRTRTMNPPVIARSAVVPHRLSFLSLLSQLLTNRFTLGPSLPWSAKTNPKRNPHYRGSTAPQRRSGCAELRHSAGVDGDSADAPVHLDADGGLALAGRGVAPMVALLLQAANVDFTQAAAGPRLDPGIGRQQQVGLSDAAMHLHGVVVLGRLAAQVEFDAPGADVHLHAAQVELAQIQPVLSGAAMEREIERNGVVEPQPPFVFCVSDRGRIAALVYTQRAAEAALIKLNLRLP